MVSVPLAPEHAAPPSVSSAERGNRQSRSDSIVSHLRLVKPQTADARDLTAQLIESNISMAVSIASRFKNRGIDLDDLQQVALLGLTKAAQRFDPDAGHEFMSFAVPTIRGEIRRYFRDSGWAIRPPRRVQELQPRIFRAQRELEQELNRSPRPSEVAEHLGVELDAVVEALTVDGYFAPTSLDATVGEGSSSLGELIGDEDPALVAAEAKVMLDPLLAELSARDRRAVQLRYHEGRTQQEIADELGLTQAQVSRILARILSTLRAGLNDPAHAERTPGRAACLAPIIRAG